MKITNLTGAEFKTLVIRMPKEFTEYGNSIKKTQVEMKFILNEMKNLQGTNSGEHEAKNQINLEQMEEKAFKQDSKKEKEFTEMRIVQGTSGTSPDI